MPTFPIQSRAGRTVGEIRISEELERQILTHEPSLYLGYSWRGEGSDKEILSFFVDQNLDFPRSHFPPVYNKDGEFTLPEVEDLHTGPAIGIEIDANDTEWLIISYPGRTPIRIKNTE